MAVATLARPYSRDMLTPAAAHAWRLAARTWLHKFTYVLSDILTLVEGTIRDAFRPAAHGLRSSRCSNNLRHPRKSGDPGGADHGMSEKRPCVYILASKRNGTLYVGVTSDIARRAWQHHSNAVGGFVRNYGVHRLVFVEFHETMADAILREKRIKK